MRNFGIICEFNPFHNGHKQLFLRARELGAERIVCVMSGNAVQRGDLACFDKYVRAKAAIAAGADLVLELPFPWSASGAEYFSRAGISIVSQLCDSVIFGSECGDIKKLSDAARIAASESFREEFHTRTGDGERAAEVYFDMLSDGAEKFSSNDLLGIEYIRAVQDISPELKFYTLKRKGAAYNSENIEEGQAPSAATIRHLWQNGCFEDAQKHMPKEVYGIFEEAYYNGDMSDIYQLSRAILMYFRLADPSDFLTVAESGGGIYNRIRSLANECVSLEDLYKQLSTKRYTDAKLHRALLFCLCGVESELLKTSPEYTLVLAANEKGRELLSIVRRSEGGINIVTKPADVPMQSAQFEAQKRLEAVFSLAKMQPGASGEFLRKNAIIV